MKPLSPQMSALLAAIADEPNTTTAELAADLGKPVGEIYCSLDALLGRGLVTKRVSCVGTGARRPNVWRVKC